MVKLDFTQLADVIKQAKNQGALNNTVDLMRIAFPELTLKQRESLFYLCSGIHVSDVASVNRVKYSTSQGHIDDCKERLGLNNNTDLRSTYYARMEHLRWAWNFGD